MLGGAKLALAFAASSLLLQAQPFGGFTDARIRTLGDDELTAPAHPKARLPLTLVVLRGTNWSQKRVLRHVRRTASTFAACGIALGPVSLVEAKAPGGPHDLAMDALHPRAGAPRDVLRLAGLLPRSSQWPAVFFVGRLLGDDALARSYGQGDVSPGREKDYPYMNTAWIAYKTHWIERRDEDYSSLAHELAHLLCSCGHVADDEPHLMNTYRNLLSSRILPQHCDKMLESPLLVPEGSAKIDIKP